MRLVLFFIIVAVSLNVFATETKTEQPASLEAYFEKAKITAEEKSSNLDKLIPRISGERKDKNITPPWIGYVSRVEGHSMINRYDESGENIILSFHAEEGMLIRNGDDVGVESRSSLDITFKNRVKLSLGPRTVFKINRHDVTDAAQTGKFNLFMGSARLRVHGVKLNTVEKMYAPNVVLTAVDKSDVVVKYDDQMKTTLAMCFEGSASFEQKSYERVLGEGKFMKVEPSYENNREVYQNTEPEDISREYKKEILESFYGNPDDVSPWEYTGIGTSFLRFIIWAESWRLIDETSTHYGLVLGYIPTIRMFSIFYLEPYFETTFASAFDLFFFRAGGRLEAYIYHGLYVGVGGGIFWRDRSTAGFGTDMAINIGYTFAEKVLGVVDGLRVAYQSSKTVGIEQKSVMMGVIFNFGYGRDLY